MKTNPMFVALQPKAPLLFKEGGTRRVGWLVASGTSARPPQTAPRPRMVMGAIALLLALATAPARAGVPSLSLVASNAIATNATFTVAAVVSNIQDLAGFEVSVTFDATRLDLEAIERGAFLGPDTQTAWRVPSVAAANTAGLIDHLAAVRLATNGAAGAGTLFTLQFREQGGGGSYATAIRLVNTNTLLANAAAGREVAELNPAFLMVWGDSDGDGLPDQWEMQTMGSTGYGAADDPDGDAETMLEEYLNGTQPANACSASDTNHVFRGFHFELFRNAIQNTAGAEPDVAARWGVSIVCYAPAGQQILAAGFAVPQGEDARQTVGLGVNTNGSRATFYRNTFDTFSGLQKTFRPGVYRGRMVLDAGGGTTQQLMFAFSVPTYSATNFPPFPRLVVPTNGAVPVAVAPLLQFGDTNWQYLAISDANGNQVYGALGDSTSQHQVAPALDTASPYLLALDRCQRGTTWLGSRTWALFATTPGPGTLQLAFDAWGVVGDGRSVTIAVSRVLGAVGEAGVDYATANGTALAGRDYTGVSGRLLWTNGQSSAGYFTVPVFSNRFYGANKTFAVYLSNPSGAALGTPSSAPVTIVNVGAVAPGIPWEILLLDAELAPP